MNTKENKKVNIPDEISAEKNPRWAWKQGYEQGVRDERERILKMLPQEIIDNLQQQEHDLKYQFWHDGRGDNV